MLIEKVKWKTIVIGGMDFLFFSTGETNIMSVFKYEEKVSLETEIDARKKLSRIHEHSEGRRE